ncbi:hypothetical protein DBR42_01340, partial [Pelomonas sp. HMWF004]
TGPDKGFDRVTKLTYDRTGRVSTTTLLGATTGLRNTSNGTLGERLVSLRTANEYDGTGNITRTTQQLLDANGALIQEAGQQTLQQTTQIYDKLGRLVATVNNVGGVGNLTGTVTSIRYDALGNAVQSTRHANLGTLSMMAPAAGQRYTLYVLNALPPADAANDQTTTTLYDTLGRAIRVRDALNSVLIDAPQGMADRFMSYDAAGRVAKQWQAYRDSEGWRNSLSVFRYDKVGQQTETTTLTQRQRGDAMTYAIEGAVYNAFGEITAKTLQERIGQDGYGTKFTTQQNWYDAGGRLWKTVTGPITDPNNSTILVGGITKVFWYDLQDHVTATFTSSASAELSVQGTVNLAAVGQPQQLAAYTSAAILGKGVSRADTTYDRLGRATGQTTNGSTHTTGVLTTSASQTLDRWGNVISVTKNGTERLRYRYDAGNRVISEVQVNNDIWDANGNKTVGNVDKRIYYDAWGHNIGNIDGLGNTNAAQYNNLGQLQYEYHADGGVVTYTYDDLGRMATRRDEVGRLYTYSYDRADHETSRSVSDATGGTFGLGSSVYDELGRKKSDKTGKDTANWDETRTYDYDARGLMWKATDALGKSTLTEYDLGGRKKKETDTNGLLTEWAYDQASGLLIGHTDLGGATYSYSYNLLGQLKTQTNTRGQNVAYAYFEDGQVQQIIDYGATGITSYDYDVDGNRTREIVGGYRNVTATYDNQGRLTSAKDTANAWDMGLANEYRYIFSIGYDAAGNRRRIWGSKEQGKEDLKNIPSAPQDDKTLKNFEQRFSYDAMNRLTTTVSTNADSVSTTVTSTTGDRYDQAGRRTATVTLGTGGANGSRTSYEYDFANRLLASYYTQLQGATETPAGAESLLRSFQYIDGVQRETTHDYDQPNNVNSLYRTRISATTYDAQGRATNVLEQAQGRSAGWYDSGNTWHSTYGTGFYTQSSQDYAYDAVGNLAQIKVNAYVDSTSGGDIKQVRSTFKAATNTTDYSYYLFEGYL